MKENTKHIDLLSKTEIDDLYARPVFNDDERAIYFKLNERETLAAEQYGNLRTRLYFILQTGYFKAKQQFYSFFIEDVIDDAIYVNKLYFNSKEILSGKITREYLKSQKDSILKLYSYLLFSDNIKEKITEHLCSLIKIYPKHNNALRQLIIYFEQKNIVLPTYRNLQELFGQAYRIEKNRLNNLMLSIPENIKTQLNTLIKNDDGISDLNTIKSDQKDFQYTAVKLEVDKANKIASLYRFSKFFIPKLEISKNAIQYYADVTEQYASARIRRLKEPQQWLRAVLLKMLL